MHKRLLGSAIFAGILSVLMFATAVAFLGTSTQAAVPSAQSAGMTKPDAVATGAWSDITPFPTVSFSPTPGSYPLKLKRAGAACYFPNGKCYVMGGRHGIDGEDITSQFIWEYTPGSPDSWTRKNALLDASQPGSRYTANMAVVVLTDTSGPRVYAIGGSSIDSQPTPIVRVYDPGADTVTTLSSDPWPAAPVRVPGGYAVYNNKLYVFGGFSALGSGSVFTDTWVFDPMGAAGAKWTQIASGNLNLGRAYIAGAALDGKIYAIGGDRWQAGSPGTLVPVNNVEVLDPSQGSPTWQNIASLPTSRGDLGAWAYNTGTNYEISGRILVAGGIYPTPDANAYIYTPGSNSWATYPSMIHATRNYGVAQMNGMLYAFGGYDYSNGTPSGGNFNQAFNATAPLGTNTPTITGTRPTNTNTPLATNTVQATPTPCSTNYADSGVGGGPTTRLIDVVDLALDDLPAAHMLEARAAVAAVRLVHTVQVAVWAGR